jgi:hypothetical protein
MWCCSCRQDVPGVLNVLGGSHVCPRCGTLLAEDAGLDLEALAHDESAAAEFGIVDPIAPTAAGKDRTESRTRIISDGLPELPDFEPTTPPRAEPTRSTSLRWEAANWELNEKLRHVERVTATGTHRRFDPPASADERRPHFDAPSRTPNRPYGEAQPPSFAPPSHSPYEAPHYAPSPYPSPLGPSAPSGPGPHSPASPYESNPHEWNERADREYDDYEDDVEEDYEPRPSTRTSSPAETAASLLSWTFLGLAVAAFSGGGFLAGWGAIASRPNLEKLGMPIILAGLLALVIGTLPQLFLRQAEEERRRRTAQRSAAPQRESRGHRGVRAPHFTRRRSRDHDRSRDD